MFWDPPFPQPGFPPGTPGSGFSDQGPAIFIFTHPQGTSPPRATQGEVGGLGFGVRGPQVEQSGAKCFQCHLFGAPPCQSVSGETVGQLGEFLGAGEARVGDILAPALACEEKLPPSAWRGWDVKQLGRSCNPPFPDPLPEGWRLPALQNLRSGSCPAVFITGCLYL